MQLLLFRHWFTIKSSIGVMNIRDDDYESFTIEDCARAYGVKIKKETAIEASTYRVIMDYSARHKIVKPHILNVPLFTGIRFDIANWARQIEGCIAVGNGRGKNAVWDSRNAYIALCERIDRALARKELIWLTIENQQKR